MAMIATTMITIAGVAIEQTTSPGQSTRCSDAVLEDDRSAAGDVTLAMFSRIGFYGLDWQAEAYGIALQMVLPMLAAAAVCWIFMWRRSTEAIRAVDHIPTAVFVGIASYPLFVAGRFVWSAFPHWDGSVSLVVFLMLLGAAPTLAFAAGGWWAREGLVRSGRKMPWWVVATIFVATVAVQHRWWRVAFSEFS